MQFATPLLIATMLTLALAIPIANPSTAALQDRSNFLATCTIDGSKLDRLQSTTPAIFTECDNGSGKTARTIVNLNDCVGNSDGTLVRGVDFGTDCVSCVIDDVTTGILSCTCKTLAGVFQQSSFNLNGLLDNDRGQADCPRLFGRSD